MNDKNGYTIKIEPQPNNKIDIEINHQHSQLRRFRVIVTKDGLAIETDGRLQVLPMASNRIEIDTL